MSDISEGLGTAVEGGLLAAAVDPEGNRPGHGDMPVCLNCGALLAGPFCHRCGQKGHVHRTLSAVMHDLAHGVLHLDGKLWNTLPMLALRPGRLTRDYIDGKRARYVSPMAMFLFSVFLMFAVFQALGIANPGDKVTARTLGSAGEFHAEVLAQRNALETSLAALPASDPRRAETQTALRDIDALLAGLTAGDQFDASDSFDLGKNPTGIQFIDRTVLAKWRQNPSLMLYKLQANSYKFSWLLIPLSIPFVWVLFLWRREFRAYDHAIFVTYSLAFMSLLFIALSLLRAAGAASGWVIVPMLLISPVHLYRHLRHTYRLTRLSAAWRLALLSLFIVTVLILFMQILLLLGGV